MNEGACSGRPLNIRPIALGVLLMCMSADATNNLPVHPSDLDLAPCAAVAAHENVVACGDVLNGRVKLSWSVASTAGYMSCDVQPPSLHSADLYGQSVSLSATLLAVGAPGSNTVFVYNITMVPPASCADVLSQPPLTVADSDAEYFGVDVALNGSSSMAVAAHSGQVAVYQLTPDGMVPQDRLVFSHNVRRVAFANTFQVVAAGTVSTDVSVASLRTAGLVSHVPMDGCKREITNLVVAGARMHLSFSSSSGEGCEQDVAVASRSLAPGSSWTPLLLLTNVTDNITSAMTHLASSGPLVSVAALSPIGCFVSLWSMHEDTITLESPPLLIRTPVPETLERWRARVVTAVSPIVSTVAVIADTAGALWILGREEHGNYTEWSPWSNCSSACGPGLRSRHRSCTNPAPARGGRNCSGPAVEYQDCAEYTHTWVTSPTAPCDADCGEGDQPQAARCVRCDGANATDTACDHQPRPPPVAVCHRYNFSYVPEPFGSCVVANGCGWGLQSRPEPPCLRCDGEQPAQGAQECWGQAPLPTHQECESYTYHYVYEEWQPCGDSNTCGSATQQRGYHCSRCDGLRVDNALCDGAPITEQTCERFKYSWYVGSPWGSCRCGNTNCVCSEGSKTGTYRCRRCDGTFVSDSYCQYEGRPSNYATCSVYSYQWVDEIVIGATCSAACGAGTIAAKRFCKRCDEREVHASYCGRSSSDVQTYQRSCNNGGCGCILSTDTVHRSDGKTVALHQVEVGDKVQAMDASGAMVWSPVYLRSSSQWDAAVLTEVSVGDKRVTTTADHLVAVAQRNLSQAGFAPAGRLHRAIEGYFVEDQATRLGNTSSVLWPFTHVTVETVYTLAGTIVVNDVVLSCYDGQVEVAETDAADARVMYHIVSTLSVLLGIPSLVPYTLDNRFVRGYIRYWDEIGRPSLDAVSSLFPPFLVQRTHPILTTALFILVDLCVIALVVVGFGQAMRKLGSSHHRGRYSVSLLVLAAALCLAGRAEGATIDVHTLRDSARTGDMVLVTGTDLLGTVIRLATGAAFSHVGMIVRDPTAEMRAAYSPDSRCGDGHRGGNATHERESVFLLDSDHEDDGSLDGPALRPLVDALASWSHPDNSVKVAYLPMSKVRMRMHSLATPGPTSGQELSPKASVDLERWVNDSMGLKFDHSMENLLAVFEWNVEEDTQTMFCSEYIAETLQKIGWMKEKADGGIHSNNVVPRMFESVDGKPPEIVNYLYQGVQVGAQQDVTELDKLNVWLDVHYPTRSVNCSTARAHSQ